LSSRDASGHAFRRSLRDPGLRRKRQGRDRDSIEDAPQTQAHRPD